LDQDYTHLVSLDASNAFNAISRSIIADMIRKHIPSLYKCAKWAYQTPADLVVGEWILESRQGVRHGDPVGPLLFPLGLRPLLETLQANLGPGRKVVSYLDDIFIWSTDDKALCETEAFLKDWTDTLRLNPRKCKSVSLEEWIRAPRYDGRS